jgi:uncharacterized protein (DUF2236 family)
MQGGRATGAVQNGAMERPRPGGITWTIAGERIAVLTWPRAILLQLAHPLVAAGVAQHSGFRTSRFAPFVRLHATVRTMRELTFGTNDQAAAAVQRILGIHDRVNGALAGDAGAHARGARFSAHDPDLLLWVHATLIESHVRILEHVLRPFTANERDGYCRETASLAIVLGAARADVPTTWRQLQDYMTAEIESGRVAVGADARALAPAILRPPMGWLVWPLQHALELVTVGSLPAAIRADYGLAWDAKRERRRRQVLTIARRLRRFTPDWMARWPEARLATDPRTPLLAARGSERCTDSRRSG